MDKTKDTYLGDPADDLGIGLPPGSQPLPGLSTSIHLSSSIQTLG